MISSYIGKPIKADFKATLATKGQFALVCVEIDLSKPFDEKFWLNSKECPVEYEGLLHYLLATTVDTTVTPENVAITVFKQTTNIFFNYIAILNLVYEI